MRYNAGLCPNRSYVRTAPTSMIVLKKKVIWVVFNCLEAGLSMGCIPFKILISFIARWNHFWFPSKVYQPSLCPITSFGTTVFIFEQVNVYPNRKSDRYCNKKISVRQLERYRSVRPFQSLQADNFLNYDSVSKRLPLWKKKEKVTWAEIAWLISKHWISNLRRLAMYPSNFNTLL